MSVPRMYGHTSHCTEGPFSVAWIGRCQYAMEVFRKLNGCITASLTRLDCTIVTTVLNTSVAAKPVAMKRTFGTVSGLAEPFMTSALPSSHSACGTFGSVAHGSAMISSCGPALARLPHAADVVTVTGTWLPTPAFAGS